MGVVKHLSVIIPVYNEEENVQLLHQGLRETLDAYEWPYEIVYVDDGSTDATFSRLRQLAEHDTHVCIVQLKRNFGQTIALRAGIEQSTGGILVFMDGDLQNDPCDIPRLPGPQTPFMAGESSHSPRHRRTDTRLRVCAESLSSRGVQTSLPLW